MSKNVKQVRGYPLEEYLSAVEQFCNGVVLFRLQELVSYGLWRQLQVVLEDGRSQLLILWHT